MEEEHTNKRYVLRQALAGFAVGWGGVQASLIMGYTSSALPAMMADPAFPITEEQGSWVGALMPACALMGSLVAGPLVDQLGRRATLLAICLPFTVSWLLVACAGGVGVVMAGRMLGGACVGVQTVAGSVYLPEILQLDLRVMHAIPALLGNLGLVLSFAAGQALSWRGLAWLGVALCVPLVFLLLPLPETPRHLTCTGREAKSKEALTWLRKSMTVVNAEQKGINLSRGSTEVAASLADLTRKPNLWPVSVGITLMICQQLTGLNAIIFNAVSIFEDSGVDGSSSSVIIGVVNFVMTLAGVALLGLFDRRTLLRASTLIVVTSLLGLSTFLWAKTVGGAIGNLANSLTLVPVVALTAYMVGFGVGWGPIPWVFTGEGLPSRVRGLAASVIVATNWATAFVITKTFSWSMKALGAHTTFLVYAALTLAGQGLLDRTMPETRNRSVEEMDKLYAEGKKKAE